MAKHEKINIVNLNTLDMCTVETLSQAVKYVATDRAIIHGKSFYSMSYNSIYASLRYAYYKDTHVTRNYFIGKELPYALKKHLEWASKHDTHCENGSIPVVATNEKSGISVVFDSPKQASDFLGIGIQTVYRNLANGCESYDSKFDFGYEFEE